MSVQNRCKLLILVNYAGYCVRIDRAQHTVDDHRPDCYLPCIGLVARFAVDQVCQKIPVTLCKAHLGNVPPCRFCSKTGFCDFLLQLFFEGCNIFILLCNLIAKGVRLGLCFRNLSAVGADAVFGVVDARHDTRLLLLCLSLQIIQLRLFLLQLRLHLFNRFPLRFVAQKHPVVVLMELFHINTLVQQFRKRHRTE